MILVPTFLVPLSHLEERGLRVTNRDFPLGNPYLLPIKTPFVRHRSRRTEY